MRPSATGLPVGIYFTFQVSGGGLNESMDASQPEENHWVVRPFFNGCFEFPSGTITSYTLAASVFVDDAPGSSFIPISVQVTREKAGVHHAGCRDFQQMEQYMPNGLVWSSGYCDSSACWATGLSGDQEETIILTVQ